MHVGKCTKLPKEADRRKQRGRRKKKKRKKSSVLCFSCRTGVLA
jgi:hypothetical protein